jgi:hypothetical protein
MKKLVGILLAGAVAAAMAQDPVQTQAKEFEQIKVQLQEKLGNAIDQVGPEVEKARQAANALQAKLNGKNPSQQKAIMDQERAKTQAQLQAAIEEINKVSAKLAGEVDQAKQQIQNRLQEKTQELKAMQERLQNQPNGGPGK